ncbi:caspase family protein [Hahella ganghwensis]|uniref:caspase family protein n=1 Tax=Hahella ganghwensis TaxID=286420 RepID=UPI00039A61C0|nr:caspase family protein [Hahella ganghwensis]
MQFVKDLNRPVVLQADDANKATNESNRFRTAALVVGLFGLSACSGPAVQEAPGEGENADDLMVVDCLLPGQVRQLGASARFLTARRPIKTTASDCAIRGGEYTAFDRADYATALKVWLDQAKTGDPEAQTYVGEIYEKGLGLTPDYEVAAIWYKRAAQQNFTRAQINLGNLYEKGLGVKKDPIQALNWYRKASGLNSDNLQYASTIIANEVLQSELSSLQGKVSELETTQQQTKAELERARKEAAELAGQQEQQNELALMTADSMVPPPAIQILDPPISLTRSGPTALLRSAVSTKEVIGKVESSIGVRNFSVNGQPVELDEYNLFFVSIPVTGSRTNVSLRAEDIEEQQVGFEFTMFLDQNAPVKSKRISFNAATQAPEFDGVSFGRYYALVIGNQDYQHYTDLETPENDARQIAELLSQRYGFTTQLVLNANRYEILSALNDLREKLTEKDNLLIYYAGHGELDAENDRGYWLPVDAEPGNTANWLSNVSISDQLNTLQAKHVMVVADSCYAGTLSTASVARQGALTSDEVQKEWIEVMQEVKARTVMTSGGVRPVLDSGGGTHSVFARSFIEALNGNSALLDGNRLFLSVLGDVRKRSKELGLEQIPDYGAIKYAGHEAGEFFFVPAS